jgi:hypothetical protein
MKGRESRHKAELNKEVETDFTLVARSCPPGLF